MTLPIDPQTWGWRDALGAAEVGQCRRRPEVQPVDRRQPCEGQPNTLRHTASVYGIVSVYVFRVFTFSHALSHFPASRLMLGESRQIFEPQHLQVDSPVTSIHLAARKIITAAPIHSLCAVLARKDGCLWLRPEGELASGQRRTGCGARPRRNNSSSCSRCVVASETEPGTLSCCFGSLHLPAFSRSLFCCRFCHQNPRFRTLRHS